ncbi:hypothetical protein ACQ4PT_056707 [Festuca glaucescens]
MSMVRRCPFADLWVDPFDGFCSIVPASWDSNTAGFANARVDLKETPEAHVFKADLPGVKKEEVKVEVEDGNAAAPNSSGAFSCRRTPRWRR